MHQLKYKDWEPLLLVEKLARGSKNVLRLTKINIKV